MAHVLLPCDLPSWADIQRSLEKLQNKACPIPANKIMAHVHETSSISLDPEDSHPIQGHPGFDVLGTFLSSDEKFLSILPNIAVWASKMPSLKPKEGMQYSLRTEENTFCLERPFVVSLLANAFFSTFPRRKNKTHPTLMDFTMADFFTHLDRNNHQTKLKAFLHYFEGLESEPDGMIKFTRKLFRGPSLPGWLCSENPLVPLIIRPQGNAQEAEPWVFRGCSCSSHIGYDVLKESTAQESDLFFEFPELLASLCFVEGLVEEEALIVEGVRAPNTQEVNFCFLDTSDCNQFEDKNLLKALNKAVAAFTHEPRTVDRRRTPDGGESSEEGRLSTTESMQDPNQKTTMQSLHHTEKLQRLPLSDKLSKSLSQASSKFSMRTARESPSRLEDDYYTAEEGSEKGSDSISHSSEAIPLPPYHHKQSSSRGSLGFVLGNGEDDEDASLQNRHERLEDFRRRIRRRTRRRTFRRSSSYSSGGSSSDMEDISEDPEDNYRPPIIIRPACSEPSLVNIESAIPDISPWISPDVLLSPSNQKQLAATCSGGHLKAYSHDGVRPNLPVPFRARFRDRRKTSCGSHNSDMSQSFSEAEKECSRCPVAVDAQGRGNEDPQLRALVLWLAASMAQLPALILYTAQEPELKAVIQVYNQVLKRKWMVGDLACEVLRFCRNQITPGHRTGKHNFLFGQLMANDNEQTKTKKKVFKDQSLD